MSAAYLKRLCAALGLICVLSAQTFLGQASSSACTGDNLLFYNTNTGAAVSGKISSSGFTTYATYTLPTGSTQVVHADTADSILLYNGITGAAAEGTLTGGIFTTTQNLSGFARGWTNILYAGLHDTAAKPLFYNASNGAGQVGFAPIVRSPGFATGWTHIVWDGSNLLFVNINAGTGAVVVDVPDPNAGPFGGVVYDLSTTKGLSGFGRWNNITVLGSEIFFYFPANGVAAVGRLLPATVGGANSFVTDQVYSAGYFGPNWTHVIGTANNLALFYNSATGDAAIVKMYLPGAPFSPFPPSSGIQFQTVAVVPHGQLAAGYTHVACSSDVTPPEQPR